MVLYEKAKQYRLLPTFFFVLVYYQEKVLERCSHALLCFRKFLVQVHSASWNTEFIEKYSLCTFIVAFEVNLIATYFTNLHLDNPFLI